MIISGPPLLKERGPKISLNAMNKFLIFIVPVSNANIRIPLLIRIVGTVQIGIIKRLQMLGAELMAIDDLQDSML